MARCERSTKLIIARNRPQNPYTFWFGWGPAGEPVIIGARPLAQKPLPYKVNGVFEVIVFSLRKPVLLDVDVFCIRWLLFCFASIFQKKKERKRSIHKSLCSWQLNFYRGHHEPVDRHWSPVKLSSFTKTARKKSHFLEYDEVESSSIQAFDSVFEEAQWPIGYGVGLRIKRSSVRIRTWPLRWVLGQGSLLPLSQGEAFTLVSISYLAILVKYIGKKKKKITTI